MTQRDVSKSDMPTLLLTAPGRVRNPGRDPIRAACGDRITADAAPAQQLGDVLGRGLASARERQLDGKDAAPAEFCSSIGVSA
jgi:hypothetical protein